MKTAVALAIEFIEKDSNALTKEYVLKILKLYEGIQDNQLKCAFLDGGTHVLKGEERISSDKYFEIEFSN